MNARPLVHLRLAFLVGLSAGAGCAPGAPAVGAKLTPGPMASATSLVASAVSVVSSPDRAPPPIVSQPMPGEPPVAALAETRLVATTCDDDRHRADAMVAKMRTDVDEAIERWRELQPSCWARE